MDTGGVCEGGVGGSTAISDAPLLHVAAINDVNMRSWRLAGFNIFVYCIRKQSFSGNAKLFWWAECNIRHPIYACQADNVSMVVANLINTAVAFPCTVFGILADRMQYAPPSLRMSK